MTIGISALMMANSMNLTAFASEGDNNTTPVDGGTNNQEDKQETMPTAVLENVQEEAADAKEAVEEAIGVEAEAAAIVEADAPAQESGEETTVLEVIDAAKDMGFTEEAAAIENELDNDNLSYEADDKVGDQNVPVDVNEAIGDINTALDLMAEQDKAINDAVKDANDAAKSADDAVQKANDLLGISVQEDGSVSVSILDVVSTSSDAIDEAEKNITGATTIAEADDAMNDAQTAADSADKIVTDTQTAFDAIEKEYDEAVEKYNAAREDLNNALAEHAALRETAVADAKAAEEELQRLSDEVAKLKKEADQAAGYAKIAKLEKEMRETYDSGKGSTLTFKDDYRPLAKAIIETYYINDVLKGTLVGEIEWVEATSGSYEYKDKDGTKSTRGNVLNYGHFKYLDENGVEHEKYVNYKTAKGNNPNTGRGIVIFEKTEHVLADGTVEYRNDNWYTGDLILAQRDLPANEYVHDGLVPSYIKESADYQENLEAYLKENKENGYKMDANSLVVDQSQNDTFRANLEAATKTIAEYEALSNQAKAAQEKVDSANAKVKELEDSISKLGKQIVYLDENADFTAEDFMEYDIPAVNIKVVNALKAKLGTAKEALQAAQDQKAEIDAKLEVVKAEYQAKVAELTPSGETVTATTETETPATDDAAPAGEVAAPAPAAPAAAPAPAIIVPAALEVDGDAADIDAVSGAGEDLAQTAEIENEVAALAGTIPVDEKKIYDIVNDPTALAELIEEPGVKIRAYWWILIIAALGATGWALYRQYKKNKAAEANGGRKN